ncbi:UNVERIFIED_CONTAM: hypothetical protein Slati_2406000 [Sesamum latifolium]|uniref:Uncharacterized protein n=1 Tax=Sesamum latifolium TaxID=2727402 RepID=A0AAW2WGC9_9LAMI
MEYNWGYGMSDFMDDTRAFHLQYGRKACYFDCHRQFLPEDDEVSFEDDDTDDDEYELT